MLNKLLVITFFLSVCLISCTPLSGSDPGPYPGGDFFLDSGLKCPKTDIYPKPSSPKKAVYVLLDNSGSYQNYFSDTSQRLKDVLFQTLRPDDLIGIGLIGNQAANVVLENTIFPSPTTPIEPAYAPALTPVSNTAVGSALQENEIENKQIKDNNLELTSQYYCSIAEWNTYYNVSSPNRSDLQIFQTINSKIPTQSQAEGSTDIQSALFNAHQFFSQAREQGYTSLKLLILSDMAQTEPPQDWVKSIDLSGVYVITAMVPLDDVSTLIKSENEWTKWFETYRTIGFKLLTVSDSTTSTLASYMEK